MDIQRHTTMMEGVLTRQLKVSAIADTKVATLISINTTMLAVMAALITQPIICVLWNHVPA